MLPLHKSRYDLIILSISLLYSVWSVNSQAFSQEERVCCCVNISNACCAIDNFDIQVDQTLQSGNVPDFIQTPFYGNFTRAHVESDWLKNNFNLFSQEALNCENARILLLPTEDGKIVPVGDIVPEQINPNLCLVNFSGLVEATRLREELDLVIGFQGIAVSGNNIEVGIALRESIVGFTLPQHTFVVSADQIDSTKLDINLNIQIGQNSGHNESCFETSNLDQLFFQLGDPETVAPECRFPATAVSRDLQGSTARVDALGITQQQYLNQCYESFEVTEQAVIFTYQVSPSFGAGCEYTTDFPNYYDTYFFTVSISSTLTGESDQTLANTVQIDYRDDTLELIPCAVDDEGFDQDVSSLIPMGRLRFTVDVLTDYLFVPIAVNLTEANIQDIDLRVVNGPTFLAERVNESDVVRFVVETSECLWVITQHSEQPATQENLIGCTVDYLSQMTIRASVNFADNFEQDNVLLGDERSILYQSNNATDCPVQAVSTDVTSVYNAGLIVQDVFGNTENLNLDQDIIVRLTLDSELMTAFDGLTVVMDQLIVTLTSDEIEEEDGDFVRLYSANDKRAQMQFDFRPYYDDAHFCRSFTPAPDNVTNPTCQRFYSEGTRGVWNPFLASQLNTDFFVQDLDGQPRLALCQDRTDLKEDRFIFKPSNWIFSEFPYSTGTMSITATAFVRSCDTVGDNFARRRLQQQEGNDGTGSTIIFQNVSFINTNLVVNTGDGNTINSTTQFLQDLLIAVAAIAGTLLVAFCCCFIWLLRTRLQES